MWTLADRKFTSRFLLGSSLYPSLETLLNSLTQGQVEIVTVSLRRVQASVQSSTLSAFQGNFSEQFWQSLKKLPLQFLPNTASCRTVKEVMTTAQMSREIFGTPWIKLEVIGDEYNLSPNPFALVEAAKNLIKEGFEVFPYMTEDLVLAEALLMAGCRILMPWGSPIGSGRGLNNPYGLKTLRQRFPDVPMIIDAGIGLPSHAAQAMEMGFDGILLNTAVALSGNPPLMAKAFALAIESGRAAFEASPMPTRDFASPSTPILGKPFWHSSSS